MIIRVVDGIVCGEFLHVSNILRGLNDVYLNILIDKLHNDRINRKKRISFRY